jgi:hypothetical protein
MHWPLMSLKRALPAMRFIATGFWTEKETDRTCSVRYMDSGGESAAAHMPSGSRLRKELCLVVRPRRAQHKPHLDWLLKVRLVPDMIGALCIF